MRHDITKKSENGKGSLMDPVRELHELRKSMWSMFGAPWTGELARFTEKAANDSILLPAVDIEEQDKNYVISAELPGLEKKDVKVELKDGGVRIYGERKVETESKTKSLIRQELNHGKFSRYFKLPEDVKTDKVKAVFVNGILKITVPRTEEKVTKSTEIIVE